MQPLERHSASVVYIEDDEKLARLTARYLESHQVRVTIATDPREGIAAVLRERPDVVLLDLMLPEMAPRASRESRRPFACFSAVLSRRQEPDPDDRWPGPWTAFGQADCRSPWRKH